MSTVFTASGSQSGDVLIVPYLFTQGLTATVDISLMGADVTGIAFDQSVTVYVTAEQLQSVFGYTTGNAGPGEDSGEPTSIVLDLGYLTCARALNDAFVAGSGGDRTAVRSITDDACVSVTTPHGHRLNWLTSNNYRAILNREDMISEISSNIPALSNLWGHLDNSQFRLSNASIAQDTTPEAAALKALFYRAAAAGKINTKGAGGANWDLSQGDQLHVYLQYQDDFRIGYEFATETFANISGGFSATQLTDNFASGVFVYFGDSARPVKLQDASENLTHTYRFQFTVSG
ncbi:hypothetical protein EB118_17145 [bacterium]|nr:hypothetical protein [Actinomycetota bacterium]NDG31783.1 hypothetical protein [bacterium]